ncbi:SMC-Scp complex subunit ScpB [Aristophania vespae]|uniref:SMC-Scp complex subunit ScpB n=1 Tax=Aristophania vespae TaxID=2697033 RepID=UPI00235132BF|nr:SMC-Scp complex subunit ScpB [Aristophania vespae]
MTFRDEDKNHIISLVEAYLFASADPISSKTLLSYLAAQNYHLESEELSLILEGLEERLNGHAFELCAVARGWQFRTKKEFASALTKIIEKPRRLTRGAMETLAVVAFHQPCTRAEIEAIRGVSLGQNILDTLIEEGLMTPKGRKEVPGRPVLWGTTPKFLKLFGLNSLSDLPKKEELVLDQATAENNEVIMPVIAQARKNKDV